MKAAAVVNIKVKKVYFTDFVSEYMVQRVVPQGKWSRENSITENAVSQVQPLSRRSPFRAIMLSNSNIAPADI